MEHADTVALGAGAFHALLFKHDIAVMAFHFMMRTVTAAPTNVVRFFVHAPNARLIVYKLSLVFIAKNYICRYTNLYKPGYGFVEQSSKQWGG